MIDQAQAPVSAPSGNATGQTQEILSAFFSEENPENDAESTQEIVESTQDPVDADISADTTPTDEQPETSSPDGADEHYTLAELAESLELDPAALYAAEIAMQDGTRVSLGSIKDTWQEAQTAQAKNTQASQQFDAQRKQFDAQQQQFQTQAQLAQLAQPDADETKLRGDWDALQRAEQDQAYWNDAAQKDSGQAALAMQRVQQARRDLERQIDGKVAERNGKAQQMLQQQRQSSVADVNQRIPEWSSNETYQKDWGEISKTMQGYGLSQPQIDTLWNQPPLMHLMHDHVELLRKVGQANPKKKAVLPKNLRAGGRRSQASANKTKLEAVAKRARAGDRKAQTAMAKALIGG